ncbi:MAG: ABC transporter ATP-binding protein [Clostridia bacterium]|nr:ABC transporter ATP-binding protein [Clostridia bacterium]
MKELLKHLKKYRRDCVPAPLLKLSEAVLELFVPLLVAAMIDEGIMKNDNGFIIRTALLMAGLGLAGLLLSVTAQYFSARAAVGFAGELREALYAKIQSFSYSKLDSLGTPALITRITGDVNQVQTALNLTLRLLLRSPFVVFGAAVMAFTVNARAALIFAVLIPLLAVAVFGIMLACIPLYGRVRKALEKVTAKARGNLAGARVVRAFGTEEEETAEFARENALLTAIQRKTGRIGAIMDPAAFIRVNLGIFALIRFGAISVGSGDMTRGELVALYNYMAQILVELIKLADLIITVSKGVSCAKRINSALVEESGEPACPAAPEAPVPGAPLLEFRGVSFRYEGAAADALRGVSFTLEKGESLGVIGGTGSGKSTLAELIPRFYRATEGKIYIDGASLDSLPEKELRRRIGFVPQKALLFRGSLRSNLRWRDENATDEELLAALETAQAAETAAEKGGLDSAVEQGGMNFSGGQRQRLTVARALVGRPEILVLDDSASALDFATEAALRKALKEGASERATVIVSQRAASIAHADKILVLDDGKPVGLGSHGELLQTCAVYREIYDSQFRKEAAGA